MLTLCYTTLSVFSENKLFNMLIDFFMMQMLSTITAIDDLNYPEKTETYFIVNAPYVFSACWKVSIHIHHAVNLHTRSIIFLIPTSV